MGGRIPPNIYLATGQSECYCWPEDCRTNDSVLCSYNIYKKYSYDCMCVHVCVRLCAYDQRDAVCKSLSVTCARILPAAGGGMPLGGAAVAGNSSSIDPKTFLPNTFCRCGIRFNNKIVNGENTTIESFPWQVGLSISRVNFTYCGGSIINDRFILTAAHCVEDKLPEDIHVRFAETNRDGDAEIAMVKNIYIKDYTEYTHHDIALIEIEEPIYFSAVKMPVCLPPNGKQEFAGIEAIVTGWGRLEWNGELADVLQKVSVDVMSTKECEKKSQYKGNQVHKKIICAGARKKDACQGDSGGPLVYQIGDYYEQIGIVSWGIKCAKKEYPGIYTKVSAYRNWIDEVTKEGIGCRGAKLKKDKKDKKDKKKNKEKKENEKKNKDKDSNKNKNKTNKNKRKKNKNRDRKDNKETIQSALSDLPLEDTVSKVSNKSKCKSNCQRERIPVCGSNGKTYNNLCMLELEACQGVAVTLDHNDECETTSSNEMNQDGDKNSDNLTNKKKNPNKNKKQQNKRKQESISTSTEGVEDDNIDWGNLKQAIKAIAASVET
ncbi:unnamed protein product, partial [Meganyctiphanes norvegica]